MAISIKKLFLDYLVQLNIILGKIPEELFSDVLSEGMFSLEMNAQVAANFLLRGYFPLVGREIISCERSGQGKKERNNFV